MNFPPEQLFSYRRVTLTPPRHSRGKAKTKPNKKRKQRKRHKDQTSNANCHRETSTDCRFETSGRGRQKARHPKNIRKAGEKSHAQKVSIVRLSTQQSKTKGNVHWHALQQSLKSGNRAVQFNVSALTALIRTITFVVMQKKNKGYPLPHYFFSLYLDRESASFALAAQTPLLYPLHGSSMYPRSSYQKFCRGKETRDHLLSSLSLSDFPEGWNILANAFRS